MSNAFILRNPPVTTTQPKHSLRNIALKDMVNFLINFSLESRKHRLILRLRKCICTLNKKCIASSLIF